MTNFLSKFKWFILGGIVVVAGTTFAVSQPSFTPSLLPLQTDTYYLGSTSPNLEWNGLYVKNITISGSCTGCGGSGAFTGPINSIVTTNSSGNLIATGTQLTVGNILATSSSATNTFFGNVLITDGTNLGFNTGAQPFEISGTNGLPYQEIISNKSTAGTALTGFTLANANYTNNANPFLDTYYAGLYLGGVNFNTYPGLQPNDVVLVNSDGNIRFAALSTNPASSTITFSVGPGFTSANYDSVFAQSNQGVGYFGISTTSPKWPLSINSTSTPQISLIGQNSDNGFTFREAGNNLYIATSSPTTYATSSKTALLIDSNGFLTISANAGVGCGQFDVNGKLTNTGVACGTGGGGSNSFAWPFTPVSAGIVSTTSQINLNGFLSTASSTVVGQFETTGNIGIATSTPFGRLSINPLAGDTGPALVIGSSTGTSFSVTPFGAGDMLDVASTSGSGIGNVLQVAQGGNGTTTVTGLTISGYATSTSNVGFNITTGCYAIGGTCISGSGGGGGVTSLIGGTNITVSGPTGAVTVNGLAFPFTTNTNFNSTTTAIGFTGANSLFTTGSTTLSGAIHLPLITSKILATDSLGNVYGVATSSLVIVQCTLTVNQTAPQSGTNYTTIQAALNAANVLGGGRVCLTDQGGYTITQTIKIGSNITLQGNAYGTQITGDGLVVSPFIQASSTNITNSIVQNLILSQSNVLASTTAIGIDSSNMSVTKWDDIEEGGQGFGKNIVLNDTANQTFYDTFQNIRMINGMIGIYASSTNAVNDDWFNNIRIQNTAATTTILTEGNGFNIGSFCIYLNNAQALNFTNIDCEPTTAPNHSGVYMTSSKVAGIQFNNLYAEGNSTGVTTISSGAQAVSGSIAFHGGEITANTVNVADTISEYDNVYLGSGISFNTSFTPKIFDSTSGSSAIPLTVTVDTSAASQNALLVQDATNFAHAGDLVNFQFKNGSDSGNLLKLTNPGTGATILSSLTSPGANNFKVDNLGRFDIGTTTGVYDLNIASSTQAQLALSAGAGIPQWTFRNAGGSLYISTTTVQGLSTTSISAFMMNGNGNVGIGTTTPTSKVTIIQTDPNVLTTALTIDGAGASAGAEMALNRGPNSGEEANIDFNTLGTEFWQLGMQNNNTNDFELWDGQDDPAFTIKNGTNAIGFGTTTPFGDFAINADYGDAPGLIFNVASSSATATTTLFAVSSSGNVGVGTTSPGTLFSIQGVANFQVGTTSFLSATGGINITGGCYAINGTCVGAVTGGSGGSPGGSGTELQYRGGASTFSAVTGSAYDSNINALSLGTTTSALTSLTISSSTRAQLTLTSGDGTNPFIFRAIGGSLYISSSSPTTYATSTTPALSILSSGNIGIGTGVPARNLDIEGNTPFIRLGNTAPGGTTMELFAGTSGIGIGTPTTAQQVVITSGSPANALVVDTFNAGARLTVYNAGAGGLTISQDGTTGHATINNTNSVGGDLTFQNRTVTTMTLKVGGNVGIGTTTPLGNLNIAETAGFPVAGIPAFSMGSTTSTTFAVTPFATGDLLDIATSTTANNSLVFTNGSFLGIGTTSPLAYLTVVASGLAGANPLFAVATGTGVGNSMPVFEIDKFGHEVASGPLPTVSSCGTTQTITGNDHAMVVTVGSVATTACTITFANAYGAPPVVHITNRSMSITNAMTYTVSNTAITVSQTALTGDVLDITVEGIQ